MSWDQAISGTLIAFVLLGLGGWLLFPAKFPILLSPTLRILYAGHLLLLGSMLGYAQFYLENPAQSLADLSDAATSRGENTVFTPEDLAFAAKWGGFWLVFFLFFLSFLCLALWDVLIKVKQVFSENKHTFRIPTK